MNRPSGLLIEHVDTASIAEELGIEPGDELLAVDCHPLRDIIDYLFYTSVEELLFLVRKKGGELLEIEFWREPEEQLGLTFKPKSPSLCGNRCIFCFVHQLPDGLRKPLYVKDEDYRLSFLYGNYITLSNIHSGELDRIKEQRLSPLYISVHATDPALRGRMLGREGLPPILETMKLLADAGITMHTQVVLCPGINDGPYLEQTVSELAALYPGVSSLAVVPLGLTRHRKGLPALEPVTGEYAADFISCWQTRQHQLEQSLGGPFLFFADEFYIKAGMPFPPLETYGDFPQLENGVGMIPLFMDEAKELLQVARRLEPGRVTVVTGESPLAFIAGFLEQLSEKCGVAITIVPVPNRLFGERVTVTGLVSGQDIIAALTAREIGDMLMIPDVMLKEGEGLFLDDLSVDELSVAIGGRVAEFTPTPKGLYAVLEEFYG
jgi:putative radical SAM enzyme (TIGR03279 family)